MDEAKRTLQIFVRMPEDLVTALDRYLERLRTEQPGTNLSRSDVIRLLLYRALKSMEEAESEGHPDVTP
jgi:metal-responsive CopG/Arc/MetJ family transcriptional regulator